MSANNGPRKTVLDDYVVFLHSGRSLDISLLLRITFSGVPDLFGLVNPDDDDCRVGVSGLTVISSRPLRAPDHRFACFRRISREEVHLTAAPIYRRI